MWGAEVVFGILLLWSTASCPVFGEFTLTVLHTNDVHSHIEESSKHGGLCSGDREECVGGVARIVTKVNEIKKMYPDTIFVNAGDFFQGTAWYTVLKEALISEVMVKMGYDYACLGNHEFDNGPASLALFLEKVARSRLKIVSCNTDFSRSSKLRHIKLPKSVVANMHGTKVGIIGAVLEDTKFLSNPGTDHPPENEPAGPYPTTVLRGDGSTGLVVQAFWFGKFLGFLRITFDNSGKVSSWSGNPILIDSSVPDDPYMLSVLEPYRERVYNAMRIRVGSSRVNLEHAGDVCRLRECNLGNLLADSFFSYYANKMPRSAGVWSNVNAGIINGGTLRAPLPRTNKVTMGDILSATPFGQTVVVATMNGTALKRMMEISVSRYNQSAPTGAFLQLSGMRAVFNMSRPPGKRLTRLRILCTKCFVPMFEDVSDLATYNIVTTDFLAKGGDGYDECSKVSEGGPVEYEILVEYVKRMSPIKTGIEGRVILKGLKKRLNKQPRMVKRKLE
ncbi:5'-nucleotidase-like isoform X4 [Haemaphysalis longicornis]